MYIMSKRLWEAVNRDSGVTQATELKVQVSIVLNWTNRSLHVVGTANAPEPWTELA